MNAPLIWIGMPLALTVLTGLIVRRQTAVAWITAVACALLAILARALPVGQAFTLAVWSIKINESFSILGRAVTLGAARMPLVSLVFTVAALWFAGRKLAGSTPWHAPLGMAVVALLIAALAVEPFLYAALLIEVAVLLCVPILNPPTERLSQGVVRFVIFQTLAMPFILFTGWMLTGVETSPSDSALAARASILIGLGFVFLLAVFPFYTWIPLLGEQAHPYAAGFVFVMLPMVVLMFGLDFLDRYAWLRDDPGLANALRLVGVMMVATGGLWAAFQRHLGRMMGYAAIIQTGLALLAISSSAAGGLQLFAALLLPRALILWVWSLALSVLRQRAGTLDLLELGGVLRRSPFAAGALLVAHFSAVGLPLLAGYPVWLALFVTVASASTTTAAWMFIGNAGLVFAGMRSLSVFAQSPGATWAVTEKAGQAVLLSLGTLLLVVVGLFPQAFLPRLLMLIDGFTHLLP